MRRSPYSQGAAPVKIVGVRVSGLRGAVRAMEKFHTEVMATFGLKLREAREKAGFDTAKDFAES